MTTGRRGETCLPPCSHLNTVGTSSSSSLVVPESTSMGAPRFGGVGASGGRGDVAGPGATARGRSETGRCPVGGMGAFSGRGREPGGSSPPTSLAHWLPMAYVVVLGSRRRRIVCAPVWRTVLGSRRRRSVGTRATRRSSAPLLFSALPLAGVPREPGRSRRRLPALGASCLQSEIDARFSWWP